MFKLLYAGELSSNEICNKLYSSKKKGAYHALRKRLYESLIDFVSTSNLEEENSEKVYIIKYILVARSFLQQQQFSIAFKLLNKAEKVAKEFQLYPYLNEIYHTKIQFSHVYKSENLQQLITNFKENQKLYFIEEELNIVYAKIKQILKKINHRGEVVNFQEVLTTVLSEQNISINETLSFKSLYQLLTIASISAFVTKDYLQIESFTMYTFELLKEHPNKEKERFYHIQVLYMIANVMFRNKKFDKSNYFLKLMYIEMQKNKQKYYARFKLKYELLSSLNLNYTNKQEEAILKLELILKKKHTDLETILDIYLSLIVFYFQKNEIKKAYKLLSKLYHTDKWYTEKAGKEWVIKKNVIEILLLVELDYLNVFESRLLHFKRKFSSYLKERKQEKVLVFLKYVELYYNNPKEITSKNVLENIENSFEWVGAKREDIFVMSFYAWLKSKMLKKPVYEVTLHLISQAQDL